MISALTRWSPVLVYVVLSIALLVLVGWAVDLEELKRIIPGVVAMNPLTALLFILSGTAFLLSLPTAAHLRAKTVRKGILLLVILIAAIKLVEYAVGSSGGIDTLLFADKLINDRGGISNRMAINTSGCFVLLGSALWLLPTAKRWQLRVVDYLLTANLLIALLSILGYLYVVDIFYSVLAQVPMAVHTAISFLLLSLAVFFAYPRQGLMEEITSPWAGGFLARRFVPAIFLIPILLGAIILIGEWQRLYGLDFGMAVFCIGSILLFLVPAWRVVKTLNRLDRSTKEAEAALKRVNQALEAQATQLEVSNRELESFSYSVSHDLRAPLRAIGGYSQMLREESNGRLDDSGKRMLDTVIRNAEKMGRLIDELLRFSKVGRAGIHRAPLDMNQIVEETMNTLTIGDAHPPTVELTPMPTAMGDYDLISLLYQNLLSNAIKYSSKNPTPQIQAGVIQQSSRPVYYVRDNGVGFNMKYHHKLFGVFDRLHKAADFEGTGVGLAIAHKIVLAHGGDIWAESTEGEGATFYFTLEEAPAKATPPTPHSKIA